MIRRSTKYMICLMQVIVSGDTGGTEGGRTAPGDHLGGSMTPEWEKLWL